LLSVDGGRFVHHHGNSRLDGRQCAIGVRVGRRGDHHQIEAAVAEHLLETVVYGDSRMLGRRLGTPLRIPGHHGGHPHAGLSLDQLAVEHPAGEAVPDDPDPKLVHYGSTSQRGR
jgi:hypothetical protein